MKELIDKIKQKGYWMVSIRPAELLENRVNNREDLKKIVQESKVELRGWDYPHVDNAKGIFSSGQDSVASFSDWEEHGYIEYWQLYQNGMFIHFKSMKEDYVLEGKNIEAIKKSFNFTRPEDLGNKFFNVLNAIHTVTEIFVFASNLLSKIDFGENIVIDIELGGVPGRTLYVADPNKVPFMKAYTCMFSNEEIKKHLFIQTKDFLNNRDSLAVDMLLDIFSDFDWTVNRSIVEVDQKKLLERRL